MALLDDPADPRLPPLLWAEDDYLMDWDIGPAPVAPMSPTENVPFDFEPGLEAWLAATAALEYDPTDTSF